MYDDKANNDINNGNDNDNDSDNNIMIDDNAVEGIEVRDTMYIHIYIYVYFFSGTYSSVVRVSASGGGGPGFNPHHVKLSGLEVKELVGKTLWLTKTKIYIYFFCELSCLPRRTRASREVIMLIITSMLKTAPEISIIHTYVCMCIYIYIYTYIHMYVYIYI